VQLINARGGQAEHFVDQEVGHAFSPAMRKKFVDWLLSQGNPSLVTGEP
jgi:hypothetical protein